MITVSDDTISIMAQFVSVEFNLPIDDRTLHFVAQGCLYADKYPDDIVNLRDSNNTKEQAQWLIFLYTVQKYVVVKNAQYDKNISGAYVKKVEIELERRIQLLRW